LSASGLAKRAGLDPTTFNPSKRRMPDGRARWPSTESVAKVLDATGASLEAFTSLVSGARALTSVGNAARNVVRRVPLIGFAQAGGEGFFDDGGYPVGGGWDEVSLPEIGDPNAYALEISGDSMEPVFRDGDHVIVSPSAPIRRGDRVVVRTVEGEVMAKQLARRSARRVELKSLNPEHRDYSFDLTEVAWIHRILWASQ
jgi:phage repressor protein C with HTH and peptisase S24 domain